MEGAKKIEMGLKKREKEKTKKKGKRKKITSFTNYCLR